MLRKKIRTYDKRTVYAFAFAISSLFLNILSLISITAIILGIIGLVKIKKSNDLGKNLAIVSIIIGTISTVYQVFILLKLYNYI